MPVTKFDVEGMSCDHCVGAVKRAIESVQGATAEQVTIGSASARFDPDRVDAATIARAIAKAGYPAQPAAEA